MWRVVVFEPILSAQLARKPQPFTPECRLANTYHWDYRNGGILELYNSSTLAWVIALHEHNVNIRAIYYLLVAGHENIFGDLKADQVTSRLGWS